MAWATLAGMPVIEARVELPRVGAWVADVALDSADGLSGAVTLDLNGFALKGTVRRGGVTLDTTVVRVVGGAGGLPTELAPLAYRGVPLKIPLSDVLAAAGEALDTGSDLGALSTQLAFWMRRGGPAGQALLQLVRQVGGLAWRVRPSGSVWVGPETWPGTGLGDFELLREDPLYDRVQLFADTPAVLPGETFQGRRVSYVEHSIAADQLRTVLWFEAASA